MVFLSKLKLFTNIFLLIIFPPIKKLAVGRRLAMAGSWLFVWLYHIILFINLLKNIHSLLELAGFQEFYILYIRITLLFYRFDFFDILWECVLNLFLYYYGIAEAEWHRVFFLEAERK